MKDLTYKDLIKIIPLGEKMQNELISQYESYTEDKQFEIMRILWEGFDELYDQIKIAAEEKLLQDVANGTRHIEGEINDMVEEDVWEQIEKRLTFNPEDEKSLQGVRGKLEQLMTEST